MNIDELYELNLKIRKGEASKKEKEKYIKDYQLVRDKYLLLGDGLDHVQLEMLILPEAVDHLNYNVITKYINIFENDNNYGEWHGGIDDRKLNESITMPYVEYSKNVNRFMDDIYKYGLVDLDYLDHHKKIKDKSIDEYTIDDIFTELTFYIRAERFCDGISLDTFNDGTILKLLKALDERTNK